MVGAESMTTGLWAGPSGIGFPGGEVSFPLLHEYIPAMEPTKRPIPIRSSFGVKAAGVWFCAVVSSVEITAVLYPYVAFMVGTYLYLLHELVI